MPAVPLGAQLIVNYNGPGGATALNVLGFQVAGAFPTLAEQEAIFEGWQEVLSQYLSNQWTSGGSSKFIDLSDEIPVEYEFPQAVVGGETAGSCLPAQCAICVSIDARAGRNGNGRIYLPGLPDGVISDASVIDGTVITNIQDEYLNWYQTVCAPAGAIPAVYSRELGVVLIVQGVSVDTIVDTQRRRVARLDT